MFFVHKGLENKFVKKLSQDEIQELLNNGWKPGKAPSHWVTDGHTDILLKECLPLPEGFRYGQSDAFRLKNSISNKRRWQNTSVEENQDRSLKISRSIKKIWDSLPEDARQQRELHKMLTRSNWSEEEKNLYCQKMSKAAKENRATISKEEYRRRSVLGTKTKKENGTFHVSSYEDICYKELCNVYGTDDIICQYHSDNRYPFSCDFYIKSLDLFIELNIHPSHGEHLFDENNKEDSKLLEQLKIENSNWSNMIVDVWYRRDVEKYNYVIKNNLNCKFIYSSDFNDFINNVKEKRL